MSLQEKLAQVKEIAEQSLAGKSDEEISRLMNLDPKRIIYTRRGMGIYKSRHGINILKGQWKKSTFNNSNTAQYVNFAIQNVDLADLGLNHEKQIEVTGKRVGKTVVLRFRNI